MTFTWFMFTYRCWCLTCRLRPNKYPHQLQLLVARQQSTVVLFFSSQFGRLLPGCHGAGGRVPVPNRRLPGDGARGQPGRLPVV